MPVSRDALWESGHDETVEVNQRALIDKVLARYSGEFTVFRELLQNSDDAQSRAVEIRFETQGYLDAAKNEREEGRESASLVGKLPDLKTTHVAQWTFRNNGIVFRDEDWNRLKKIAEGNPDEEKIGAFGVGFYSLFSVTEEPMVTSGDQWMAFYWKDKKDQLFARRGNLPESESSTDREWTTFVMPLRESAPIPIAFDFARFLASSITFMTHLSEVSVFFDNYRLARLTKSSGTPRGLGMPKGLLVRSPSGTMTIDSVNSTALYIKAEVMKWVYTSGSEKKKRIVSIPNHVKPSGLAGGFFASLFSKPAAPVPQAAPVQPSVVPDQTTDLLTNNESSVSLKVYSATASVRLDKKTLNEIQRATKKNPPKQVKYELIYTGKDEYDASLEEEKKHSSATGSIFQGLRADLDGTGAGRIFIGHSTGQTTGIGGHMAGRFIPTVERESIDFMDRNVAIWNKELLYVGGYLARAAYELELQTVQAQWEVLKPKAGDIPPEDRLRLTKQVIHALKFFTFHSTTPSSEVGSLLENAFFSCSQKGDIPLISTQGVRSAKDIRVPDPAFTGFIKQIPMVSEETVSEARVAIDNLQARGLIKEITFHDVLQELRSRPLPHDEFIACLNWWLSVFQSDKEGLLPVRTQLIDALILSTPDPSNEKEQKIVPLNTIRFYLNPRVSYGQIPVDGPLPDNLLPVSISKAFKPEALSAAFPWAEFTVVNWISFLCDAPTGKIAIEWDLAASAQWAERVLVVLSRAWASLPNPSKDAIARYLAPTTCIPTSRGMKHPADSYFPNVNMFQDLPIVSFPSGATVKGPLERLLQDLGVRKHVDLQIVFNRMIKTNEWTISDLTKYLVSVRSTLAGEELERLRATAAFPKEGHVSDDPSGKRPRFKARDLYEPSEIFQSLGLPVIDWGKQPKWRSSSEEAKLLFELGLRRYPPLHTLIPLCASEDKNVRTIALRYLLDNLQSRYSAYDPMDFKDIKFIPASKDGKECLAKYQEVFANAEWAVMGFCVVHPNNRQDALKLRVQEHPHPLQLISLLETKAPHNVDVATAWFSLLSSRVKEFTTAQLNRLSNTRFVPVPTPKGEAGPTVRHLPPTQCYLGGGGKQAFHSKLFIFVDFGHGGNAFLSACGAQNQPSVEEVVKILLNDPYKFYELAQGPTNFLSELRNIAVNAKDISFPTLTRMKRSPVLLGLRRKVKEDKPKASGDDWDEDEWDTIYDLKKPDQIVIADDTQAYQTFGDELFTAPQEDILEGFYTQLGSPRLSQVVREDYQTSAEIPNSKQAASIRSLILERLPLFLHEHTHTPTRVSFSWLSRDNHFVVREFGKITVTKSLNHGDVRASRRNDSSAVARRISAGQIQVWIASHSQIDMYEVATSLNRLIFEAPKTNDALLFMTILSTDLRSLKRRGYNVDRILRQQKEARDNAEKARREEEIRLASQPAPPPLPPHKPELAKPPPLEAREEPPVSVPGSFPSRPQSPNQDIKQPLPVPFPSTNSIADTFEKFRRRILTGTPAPTQPTPTSTLNDSQTTLIPPGAGGSDGRTSRASGARSPEPQSQQGNTAGPGVTPLDHISKNIEVAVNSCRSESSDVLHNRERMERVKESLNEGYCDVSGQAGNLRHLGQMGVVKIYLAQDVPPELGSSFMSEHQKPLARFIHVMTALAEIYSLSLAKLHIFYDTQGGLIAFNRNGSIFLNVRYYEAWHDSEVSQGRQDGAMISWYFTLAHEMAHNLVHPHNSEHEFYMSAICEKYLTQLARRLRV